jgi:hypothetical protein
MPRASCAPDRHVLDGSGTTAPSGLRATICNVAQLTAQQQRAIDLIAAGSRDSEVAEDLGVNRTTVWRWRHHDANFQAELNLRRYELWQASTERLRSLVPCALDAIAEELEGPRRLRAAATILDLAGFKAMTKSGIHLKPSGAVTAAAIEADRRRNAELDELLKPLASL